MTKDMSQEQKDAINKAFFEEAKKGEWIDGHVGGAILSL